MVDGLCLGSGAKATSVNPDVLGDSLCAEATDTLPTYFHKSMLQRVKITRFLLHIELNFPLLASIISFTSSIER